MDGLTERGLIVYCTLQELMKESLDFKRAIYESIKDDLLKCELLEMRYSLLLETWITKDNIFFNRDEKTLFAELLVQCGFLPVEDALFKLYDEYCAEMVLFNLGIPMCKTYNGEFKYRDDTEGD